MRVKVYRDILEANDALARANRGRLDERGILCLNIIGSPGSGKTTLLAATLERLLTDGRLRPAVIEGDLATSRDADRLARDGVPVVQINTEGGCHLDAVMIEEVLRDMPLDDLDVLFIENVGNLVCPAEFDLGEHAKIVIYSVAEGDDKPEKYPIIFREAALAVINKMDLLEHVDFNLERVHAEIAGIHAGIDIIETSARKGTGLDAWLAWIYARAPKTAASAGA